LLVYEIASENAAAKDYVRGPGSFVPAFLDELCVIREAVLKGDDSWFLGRAKIQQITL
jgi:thiamine-phosphate diphosphorylase / hydroxyethylthiazole kinase